MKFEDAIEIILPFEGGYVNDPNDPGGETNFGISKSAYPNLDIKNLTRDQAIAIYRKDRWQALNLDEMPQFLQLFMLDSTINLGVSRALKILQEALGLEIDGFFGPITEGAMKNAVIGLLLRLSTLRHKFYTLNKNWPYYGKDWSSRNLEITIRALLLDGPIPAVPAEAESGSPQ